MDWLISATENSRTIILARQRHSPNPCARLIAEFSLVAGNIVDFFCTGYQPAQQKARLWFSPQTGQS
jgi:hypothetical protein